jgi:hypothetical protein
MRAFLSLLALLTVGCESSAERLARTRETIIQCQAQAIEFAEREWKEIVLPLALSELHLCFEKAKAEKEAVQCEVCADIRVKEEQRVLRNKALSLLNECILQGEKE